MLADKVFMKSLEQFQESHRFNLGSDGIQIWGGKRKPEDNVSGGFQNRMNSYAAAAQNKLALTFGGARPRVAQGQPPPSRARAASEMLPEDWRARINSTRGRPGPEEGGGAQEGGGTLPDRE